MEACPGAHWLARKLISLGHKVQIIPAQFVKPYVKSNKNDTIDAAAIAEVLTRPTMRFVPIKRVDQVGRLLLQDQSSDFLALEARVARVFREIDAAADADESARRLMIIPGIGALSATAIISAVGDAKQFNRGRDLAAWLGLVPAQYSTGGRTQLGAISRRGNPYVRKLLIHGARSCLIHLDRTKNRLGDWLSQLQGRMHFNKVVVALANKMARTVWAVLVKPGANYNRIDPAMN